MGQERLLKVVQEQSEIIERQNALILELITTLENWEQQEKYEGQELKERAKRLWQDGAETGTF